MTEVLNMLIYMFHGIFGIVNQVFNHFNAWDFLLGALIVLSIYRFLLSPLMGGRGVTSPRDISPSSGDDKWLDSYIDNEFDKSRKLEYKGGSDNG